MTPTNWDHIGRILRKLGDAAAKRTPSRGVWIDVGAHCGESSLESALLYPGLKIYALEPNLPSATKLMGRAANYFVIPFAVSEKNGIADFYISSIDAASSLLPFNEAARQSWIGGDGMNVAAAVTVPTIRLDTFMELAAIDKVDFLKVDTQGADLAVVRSAGSRLRDIRKITVEADITPVRLYEGSASRDEIVTYLERNGFVLSDVQLQSCGQEQNLTFTQRPFRSREYDV